MVTHKTTQMIFMIVFLLVCVINSVGSSATFCHHCDSQDPIRGDDCSLSHDNKNRKVTTKTEMNCIIRYTMTSHGLHTYKGIADDATCSKEFNPSCPSTGDFVKDMSSISQQPAGTTCSYCCRALRSTFRDIYCSDGAFPKDGSMIAPAATGQVHTTPVVNGATKTTEKTTTTTTKRTPATTKMTTKHPKPPVVTGSSIPNIKDVSNECSQCTIKYQAVGVSCKDTSTMCSGDKPLCMTSFLDNRGDITIIKKCASVNECQTRWWSDTRLRRECMETDPYTWSGTWSGECHYCCEQQPGENAWCNKPQYPTAPVVLLNMDDFINRYTTTTTTATPKPTTTPPPTTTTPPPTTTTTTTPKPTTTTPPPTTTTTSTTTPEPTTTPTTTTTTTPTTTTTTSTTTPSPTTTTSTTPTTTTTTSTTSPTTTTTMTTTTTATSTIHILPVDHTPISYVTRQCVQCGDRKTSSPCTAFDLLFSKTTACPHGNNFCLNLIEQRGGQKYVYKSCVDEKTCRVRWYDQSSDDDKCVQYNPATSTGDLSCYFCCTSDGCNTAYKPADTQLYTP